MLDAECKGGPLDGVGASPSLQSLVTAAMRVEAMLGWSSVWRRRDRDLNLPIVLRLTACMQPSCFGATKIMGPRLERTMRIRVLVLISTVMVLSLSACAGSRGGSIPYNSASFGAPDVSSLLGASREYHLGPGDVLTIKVFGVEKSLW